MDHVVTGLLLTLLGVMLGSLKLIHSWHRSSVDQAVEQVDYRAIKVDGRVVTLFKDKFEPPRKSDIRITEREHEVLSNLAQGSSYSAIADTMCVAADTVRFHIRNIYRKLHVHSQTAAVAKAIREDLI